MSKQYVVVELDDVGEIRSLWGPFATDEQASNWDGIPGSDPSTSYHVHPVFEAPNWEAADGE